MLTFFSAVAVSLAFVYAGLQAWFLYGWRRTTPPGQSGPQHRWSIVIAARNEAQVLGEDSPDALLPSLAPDYQSFGRRRESPYEVILVDDHSADNTADLARRFPHVTVRVLPRSAGSGQAPSATGKKAALTHGIAHATGDYIATLDADVYLRPEWLEHLDAATVGHVAVAGPVELFDPRDTWFGRWQALDFRVMMLITAASLHHGRFVMGNGANLAFAKTAYDAVGGYASPDGTESASGDDMVLLAKLAERFPGRVAFAKDRYCIARTKAKPTVGGFVQQRWRWSAKTGLNQQGTLTAVLGLTWVYHVGLLVGVPLAMVGWLSWWSLGVAWGVKAVVDFVLLREAEGFFGRGYLDWTYPVQSVVHVVYVAGVGTLALLPVDYEWKGRRHRV